METVVILGKTFNVESLEGFMIIQRPPQWDNEMVNFDFVKQGKVADPIKPGLFIKSSDRHDLEDHTSEIHISRLDNDVKTMVDGEELVLGEQNYLREGGTISLVQTESGLEIHIKNP